MALDVRVARGRIQRDPAQTEPFLDRMGEELKAALGRAARAGARHPPGGADRARAGAGDRRAGQRATVPVEIVEVPEERLPLRAETTAYFTVSEALTNVAKYAQASHATVRLAHEDGALVVEVRDDGVGGADPANGSGLAGLADRVGAADGELSVDQPGRRGHAAARRAADLSLRRDDQADR